MKEDKEPEVILKESYSDLKQLSNEIGKNYIELMSEEFDLNKWIKKVKK